MTNRKLAFIVKDQNPIVVTKETSIQEACQLMWERCVGSVLVVGEDQILTGIFTGRDAVRALAKGVDAVRTPVGEAMTRSPVTVTPDQRAIEALRVMGDGGFRHLPVVENGRIWGIVSRGDFKSAELGEMEVEQHLWECIR